MEKLVDALGITRLSKSQVSVMAAELDAQVAEFCGRPLDQDPYMFVAADALVLKVREGGRVVNVHALVATPGSTPTGTARSSGCRSPRPRTAPAGSRSSGT
jgi:transposase-like protein